METFVYWASLLASLFLVASSLLIHEMGHWLCLTRWGVPITRYQLGLGPSWLNWGRLHVGILPVGAAISPCATGFATLSPRQRFLTAIAGPAASLAYSILLLVAAQAHPELKGMRGLELLGEFNLFLAAANLLPMPPLDGYQAYSALAEYFGRPLSARHQALAFRLGNGLVWGLGFFVIAKIGMMLT